MAWASRNDVDRWFSYHPPTSDQVAALREIRESARRLAEVILDTTPGCADQSAALRKVREAVMAANAAVVIPRPSTPPRGETPGD